jgi:hypothetical protein
MISRDLGPGMLRYERFSVIEASCVEQREKRSLPGLF